MNGRDELAKGKRHSRCHIAQGRVVTLSTSVFEVETYSHTKHLDHTLV